ncbi:MAG TPA: stage II sporulation protein M [Candidatus Latescibacteria bacterium]|nr:stage II sporulation protein M [Candidatus Latescibacterota bacterium]
MSDPELAPGPNGAPPTAIRPPGLIKRLYREEWAAWRKNYRRYFKYAARALGTGFVVGFLFFLLRPDQEKKALEFVIRSFKDIRLEGSPLVLALTLFYHNSRASAIAIAAGGVPFLFLPIFDPLLNGGVLGLLVSITKHQGLDVPRLILTKILPHGVFELTAVLYATSLGLYLSAGMGRKAVAAWKRRTNKPPAGPAACSASTDFLEPYPDRVASESESLARNIIRSFVLVVLPLLLIAALIEGFITPHLR